MYYNTANALRMVSREAWGAEPPLATLKLHHPIKYVYCMSTYSYPCYTDTLCKGAVKSIQVHQIKVKKFRDMRYSFLIGGSGRVYECRGWFVEPMLPLAYTETNPFSLLLGFIGSFSEPTLPQCMRNARQALIEYGVSHKYLADDFKPYDILAIRNIDTREQI